VITDCSFVDLRDETCSVTLKEEHKLKVFESGLLRRKFLPKKEEVTGWRKL
jgi:hypothetical protein